jgi:hypothetical protein
MVMFPEGAYNPEEHNRLAEAAWGKGPEDEINLIEGVDDDAVILDALPPKQAEAEK